MTDGKNLLETFGISIHLNWEFHWQFKRQCISVHPHRSFGDTSEDEDERKWMRCFDESG